jgi:beta-phosphoglucomutase-like phosphatase (HAD superfamily)
MRIETAFLFDLDGTLVDSVYQHVLAWREALDAEGIELSIGTFIERSRIPELREPSPVAVVFS